MQVVEQVSDTAVIKRFNKLVRVKLTEAQQLPDAVHGWYCEAGHTSASFLLGGGSLAVKVVHDSEGHHRMCFAENDDVRRPAYELSINDNDELVVKFGGDMSIAPALKHQLDRMEDMPVLINELVPYGWVEQGLITTVMFCHSFNTRQDGDVEVNDFGFDTFVLEGHRMPTELKMDVTNHRLWVASLWRQIESGKLIRLSTRINSLQDKVFAKGDGTDMGYLEFEATDGQTPAFAVNQPYLFWHPRENFPGEIMKGWGTELGKQPYSLGLAGWFI